MVEWFRDTETLEEGRRLYRALARKYHPDRARPEDREAAGEVFRQVKEQWERIRPVLQARESAPLVKRSSGEVGKRTQPSRVREIVRDGALEGVELAGRTAVALGRELVNRWLGEK